MSITIAITGIFLPILPPASIGKDYIFIYINFVSPGIVISYIGESVTFTMLAKYILGELMFL